MPFLEMNFKSYPWAFNGDVIYKNDDYLWSNEDIIILNLLAVKYSLKITKMDSRVSSDYARLKFSDISTKDFKWI